MIKNNKKIKKGIKNFSTGMRILAIETSCDDTAIAILEAKKEGSKTKFKILGSDVSSQISIHIPYGGVFPALAKREHIKNLPIVLEKVLTQAKIKIEKIDPVRSRPRKYASATVTSGRPVSNGIDVIAVTTGPGLEPALWTGIVFAKEINSKYKIPIVKVNHMEGHIFSIFPKKGKSFTIDSDKKIFPMLSLLVSGGHTELILIKDWFKYKKIGCTRDDAAGEAFDKVARMLGLPYPGGPEISKMAAVNRNEEVVSSIQLPRPMIHSKDYDFSFSGLKTAVLYMIRDLKIKDPNILENENIKQQIAREFEDATVETLVYKTTKAIKQYQIKTLIVGGGVSANTYLQEQMNKKIKENKLKTKVHFPSKALTGDNALMIAIAGYFQAKNKKFVKNINSIKADGNLSL